MKEIIEQIFNNITPIICNGIEEKYYETVKQEYNKILHNRYSEIDKKLNTENYDDLYNSLYESELEEWSNLTIPMKKSILIKDNSLEEIIDISNKALTYAEERLNKGNYIDEKLANNYITKLNLLTSSVHDNNKATAKWSTNEATIDLLYASNQSDNISTRISHLM